MYIASREYGIDKRPMAPQHYNLLLLALIYPPLHSFWKSYTKALHCFIVHGGQLGSLVEIASCCDHWYTAEPDSALLVYMFNSVSRAQIRSYAGHLYYYLEDVYPVISGRRMLRTPRFLKALLSRPERIRPLGTPVVEPGDRIPLHGQEGIPAPGVVPPP